MKKNQPTPWEAIPKVKTSTLNQQPEITQKIKEISESSKESTTIKLLEKITSKNTAVFADNQIPHKHGDLLNIISNPDILRVAFYKLSKNKGANTEGTTGSTASTENESTIEKISNQIKNQTFTWSRTRRVYVPKPGKTTLRPLGLPDFNNKLVQETIRMVLEAIYEPEFEKHNCNFGFRKNKCCQQSIRNIRQKAQFADWAIEGDIKGAYDNIDHPTLMKILRLRISDNKFLSLIYKGLKAGILENNIPAESFNGVPQGGICSPILFNIYMNEFDKHMLYRITPEFISHNQSKWSQVHPDTKSFHSLIQSKKKSIKWEIQKQNKPLYFNQKPFSQERLDMLQKELEDLIKAKRIVNPPYKDKDTKNTCIYYQRYADDFIIFTSGTIDKATQIKDKISKFLLEELKLELSPDKTKITDLKKNKAKYLGFEIFFQKNPLIVTKQRADTGTTYTQSMHPICVSIDKERMSIRFIGKGFIHKTTPGKTAMPREIGWLTVLTPQEIITKYNQMMIGVGNYYIGEIKTPSELGYWIYILYYSCLKTLCTKLKLSLKTLIIEMGYTDISINNTIGKTKATDLRICHKYKVDNEVKWAVLLNYKEFMYRMLTYRDQYRINANSTQGIQPIPEIDFASMQKANWRTSFKMGTACAVCGAPPPLENHHIKGIRHHGGKFTGYKGFDKLVASLGRKQIPVCTSCHKNISQGKYNGMSLDALYDVRLTTTPITFKSSSTKSTEAKMKKSKISFEINETNKTYFNFSYNNYIRNKHG